MSAGEMEECSRLTLTLRRRLSIGQAKFEMTLKSLQGSSSLATECEEWPDGAPLDVLRRVHLLLDADDLLLQLFQEAAENDSADPTMVGTFPAEAASRILKFPDSGAVDILVPLVSLLPSQKHAEYLKALKYGVFPFGAWACVAAATEFQPRHTPEAVQLHKTLFNTNPRQWRGLGTAGELVATLTSCLCAAKWL